MSLWLLDPAVLLLLAACALAGVLALGVGIGGSAGFRQRDAQSELLAAVEEFEEATTLPKRVPGKSLKNLREPSC